MTAVFPTFETSDPAVCPEGISFVTVRSLALGQRADVTLFAPRQAAGRRGLPICILLHGVYGSHWCWAFRGAAHLTLARLVHEGAVPPMVLVMPSDGLWDDGSGYVPHATQDFEAWIRDEVPAVAHRAVPECNACSPQFIAGLSMGGYGALRLAARNPRRYAAASAHSPITELYQLDALIRGSRAGWLPGPGDGSVLAAIRAAGAALPPLRFDCGADDALLEASQRLHHGLDRLGITHVYETFAGGHDWAYWTARLENSLRFFAGVLAGAPA